MAFVNNVPPVDDPPRAKSNGHAEWPDGRFNDDDASGAPPASAPRAKPATVATVLDEWATAGRLVHEPTGIHGLDDLTGGGPVYGSRWYIAGAPDAGKTALLVQLAHTYALRGIEVGLLAVDEDAGDIVTRLAQRAGYDRIDCELRDADTLGRIRVDIAGLPISIYGPEWTIEAAAADLAARAKTTAGDAGVARAVLCIDSLQTVSCDAEGMAALARRELSDVASVTARVHAIRAVATRYGLIALVTSEMGRGAYRSSDPDQQTATLAASKWSGAVEYSARVLLGLRSVPNKPDLVDLEIAKNKHGKLGEHVFLKIDRPRQTLWQVGYDPPPPASSAARDGAAKDRVKADALVVARVLLATPELGIRDLRAAARAASGMGHDRVDAALSALGAAVVRGNGPRGTRPMRLDVTLLPAEFREAFA